jgi:succinate dehydrogenase/fumarate reductase subunit D
MEDKLIAALKSMGMDVSDWVQVSERPGKEPFAKEAEYKANGYWGKIHLRNTGELYILVITKAVKNWKESVSKLGLKGKVVDAVGGILWLKESLETLNDDLQILSSFFEKNSTEGGSQSHSH